MSTSQTTSNDESEANDESTTPPTRTPDETLIEATPSTKPVLAWLALTLVVGFGLVGIVVANPSIFGDVTVAEIAGNVVILLTAIAVVRLLVKWYVLTRTRYVVTTAGVRREYSLLYRTWSRELPLSMLRGHELTRSRIQSLFGVGTVEFLSGSVSGSMGHLRFDSLPNPDELRSEVQQQLSNREMENRP